MRIFFAIFLMCFAIARAEAQSVTVVSPFAGSELVAQYSADFDEVAILVSDGVDYQTRVEEGQVRSTIYRAPKDKSQLEIIRNFEIALEAAGFEVLFNRKILRDRFDTPAGSALDTWVKELASVNRPRRHERDGAWTGGIELDNIYIFPSHYMSAIRRSDTVETVFALIFNGQRNSYVMQEITRAVMQEDGVTISEGQLTTGIDEEGKAILYGVQFDVGSSVIRPSSQASLDVIANVLKSRTGRFYVVGHTSDTGAFETNMRLSEQRAQAIIDALGRDFGIDTSRLQAAGVGPVAPLASNTNEAGRQLNRRVELVERLED